MTDSIIPPARKDWLIRTGGGHHAPRVFDTTCDPRVSNTTCDLRVSNTTGEGRINDAFQRLGNPIQSWAGLKRKRHGRRGCAPGGYCGSSLISIRRLRALLAEVSLGASGCVAP